jgi:hypothetical protein
MGYIAITHMGGFGYFVPFYQPAIAEWNKRGIFRVPIFSMLLGLYMARLRGDA